MSTPRVAPAAPPTEAEKLASLEVISAADLPWPKTSILDWACCRQEDIKELARSARAASALATLAYTGLQTITAEIGEPTDDHETALVADVLHLADHLCFVLARKLGAVEVA